MKRREPTVTLLMALAWLGCRPEAEPRAPQSVRVEPIGSETDELAVNEVNEASAPSTAPRVVPEPPPLQTMEPIELPFAADAIVVEAVQDLHPVVLFRDETIPIRRGVGEYLAAHGHPVVPVEELERIEADAAMGQLRLEGGQTCRAPLSRAEVMARYFAGSPRATLEAQCYDGCILQVMVEDPGDEDAGQMFSTRPITRAHDPRAWARAKIHPTEEVFGVGGLGLWGSSHSPPIQFKQVDSIGPWASLSSRDRLDNLDVGRCAHPDPRVGFTYDVRVSVGADGHVSRCTARSGHSLARKADALCLCQGIETLEYSRGRAGRRLYVEAQDTGGSSALGDLLQPLQPGTEPWIERIREATVLSTCTASSPLQSDLAATIVLDLAVDGRVEKVEVIGDITTMPKIKLSSCLVRELRAIPLPCRPPGIDRLQLGLTVKVV